jgi:hypothetical protein
MENKAMQSFESLYSILKCRTLNRKLNTHLYKSQIRPTLLYGAMRPQAVLRSLQVIQNEIIRRQIYIKYINPHNARRQNLEWIY